MSCIASHGKVSPGSVAWLLARSRLVTRGAYPLTVHSSSLPPLSTTAFASLVEDFPNFEITLRGAEAQRRTYNQKMSKRLSERAGVLNREAQRVRGEGGGQAKALPPDTRPQTPPLGKSSWAEVNKFVQGFTGINGAAGRSRFMMALEYEPKPKRFAHVRVPHSLQPLLEALAQNAHEVQCCNSALWPRHACVH